MTGTFEGIPRSNQRQKKVEPLITVDKLRTVYLFGIDIFDNSGNELPVATYQQYIDNATAMLEHYLDISILPNPILEDKDYHDNDYLYWGYFQLNNYPVISIESIQLAYFRDDNGDPEVTYDIPKNWIRLHNHDGIVRLVPNARNSGQLQVGGDGRFYPANFFGSRELPDLWQFKYTSGFEDGKIPVSVNQAISYLAAIQALIIGGNLVLGAGISSQSLSIDGLSQSINTTQSAENSAYSATIHEYSDQLYGGNERERGLLKTLKDYYKGAEMGII